MKFSAQAVRQLGTDIALRVKDEDKKRDNYKEASINIRTFRSFYGRNEEDIQEIWETFSPKINKAKLKHLFWTLMYLKLYVPIDVMVVMVQTSKNTLDKYVWEWVHTIATGRVDFILWENRFRNLPEDVWCTITIDGTDFQIGEPCPFNKRWKSPKAKGGAVKYEIAISIYSGDIVWIYGPHVGGKHDLTIFREKLRQMFSPGEMANVDAGYPGETDFLRKKGVHDTKEEEKEDSEKRARHETVNRRFKQWGILKQQFRNDRNKHQMAFYAIAVLTQMDIDNGNVLFSIEPVTKKIANLQL